MSFDAPYWRPPTTRSMVVELWSRSPFLDSSRITDSLRGAASSPVIGPLGPSADGATPARTSVARCAHNYV